MVQKILKTILVFSLLTLNLMPASAEVYTTEKTEGFADCIYVLGNHDSFPLEYYNEETKAFEGVMPDLLKTVSVKTGIDFVYINGGNDDIDNLAENLQAELISGYDVNCVKEYAEDTIEVFSYTTDENLSKLGFAFTELADENLKNKLKTAISEISHNDIDGLLMKHSAKQSNSNPWLLFVLIAVGIILVFLIILLIVQNKKIKKKNRIDMMTDTETGIGNLAYFKHKFENTLGDFQRSISYVAYIILDSSYLRSYHGDTTFSDVLKFTAETISSYTAENEFAARITENGFALVYESSNDTDAKSRLEEVMKKLDEYVDIKENSEKKVFHAALYHLNQADKNSEIILFNLRKNCNKIFGTGIEITICDTHAMNRVLEEKQMVENIIKGFEREEFKLYLQFIVDAKTKEVVSAESLSRWDSKEKGLLSPGKYIGIMESDGLISKHDFYMFEMVCRQLEKWHNTEFSHIIISCNFTRITLSENGFVDKIKRICDKYTFDKSRVCIEITEDAIEKNIENALSNIVECKKLGFKIALDDLGSGYTSLANLCDYPIDVVKIDRDILLKANETRGKSLFDGIVELAHKLNLKVICEGVETEEQNSFVAQSNCDYIQGFYYYKPLPNEESEKVFLKNKDALLYEERMKIIDDSFSNAVK